jgi:phage N-6-adenine-methyltransferase
MSTDIVMSSAKDDWLTPPCIWKRAQQVMGGIDLDPCSNEGEPNIPALIHFTKEDDGLSHPWYGPGLQNALQAQLNPCTVFVNPPYNRSGDQGRFVRKLIWEMQQGHVSQAIVLIAARTDTRWFRLLVNYPRCFIWGRLKFLDAVTREEIGPATFPSVVFGLGVDVGLFEWVYRDIGDTFVSLAHFTGLTGER